jgi:D-tyrosyl-tRNA(Tyr) deacylase
VRVVIQRVTQANVSIDGENVAAIGPGMLLLVGIGAKDKAEMVRKMAAKCVEMRLFEGDDGRFDKDLLQAGGDALVVSQFTLIADVRKGRRPSFTEAAAGEEAEPLIAMFAEELRARGVRVGTGRFGAHMRVSLENDGPVTIVVDSDDLDRPRR